ncbi:hypothetical protein LO762_05390 [Actinocorallia sp. API 0066]|uniref:hypothetical protein n=1 Tax=Actinocorallia sp. API 0066 TaxID=2896846 RepID=UPI001E4FC433|nr:hypothetical protein [Actinocorallia sp. API 0066]MCD0448631.1 hypothetical protein [Actinocorallia sp. API 0066]
MAVGHLGPAGEAAAIEAVIRDFFAERRAEVDALGQAFAAAVADLEAHVLRGAERARSTFAWLGWLGAGGDPRDPVAKAVLSACAGLELLHAPIMFHGHATGTPGLLRARFVASNPVRRFSAREAAVLMGHLARIWADVMVRASGLPEDAQARVRPVWSAIRSSNLIEQVELISLAYDGEGPGPRLGAGSSAAERPLRFGAAIAGARMDLVAAYAAFGAELDEALRLRDDLLGALVGADLLADGPAEVRAALVGSGALEHIEFQIARRVTRALAALEQSGATAGAKDRLAALAVEMTRWDGLAPVSTPR